MKEEGRGRGRASEGLEWRESSIGEEEVYLPPKVRREEGGKREGSVKVVKEGRWREGERDVIG